MPESDWNGEFIIKSDQNSTTVFIIDLVELIENIYQIIIKKNEVGDLESRLSIAELETRFTII